MVFLTAMPNLREGLLARAALALLVVALVLFEGVLLEGVLLERAAWAGNEGEARSILREPDRPYSVVAGDADASGVVQNPANLGYLAGFDAVLDLSWSAASSGRRGNGFGGFVAVPLPWKILSVGAGLQYLWRTQINPSNQTSQPDDPYGKFTISIALPLMRWAPGLSIGVNYSRLFSPQNVLAHGANQVDLGISWRANRFITIAVVGRNLNAPRLGDPLAPTASPIILDPELAMRPLGDRRFEVAFGMRTRFVGGPVEVTGPHAVQPRGRLLVGGDGFRVFAEAERMTYFSPIDVGPFSALRLSAGVEFDTARFGAALAGNFGAGNRELVTPVQGLGVRLRFSHQRYDPALSRNARRVTRLSLAGKASDEDLAELLWTLDDLARHGGGVVLVETAGTGFGFAQLEELREGLLRLQDAKGKVVVYLEGGSLRHYFVAALADRIIAHPQRSLEIVGLSTQTFYWADLLERLGAKAEFVRIAEYKGTPEQFMRMGPSEPVERATEQLLVDTWNHVVRMIGRDRGHDPALISGWIDRGPWQPEAARAAGLVDALAWPDELDAELEDWLGRRVRIEPLPRGPIREGQWGAPAHVAILHVVGTIVEGESQRIPLLGTELAGAATLVRTIVDLKEDNAVKAVVVRIDSRGGSVAASLRIARELDLLRASKPVVVSIGRVGTSGGYMVATAGSYIYADATSTVGGIGVFQPKIDLSGVLEHFGASVAILAIGDKATLRSWWKPYAESEREAVLAGLQASYDRFIERVARARAMTPEAADAVARGRLWSGVRASEVGLVDRYGGMIEASDRAARMAGLAGAPEIRHYPPKPSLLTRLERLWGLRLPFQLAGQGQGSEPDLALALDPLGARALRFGDPLVQVLSLLPASLWLSDSPEPLALGPSLVEIVD
ncbi:S49 family peptidase [Nannocystaceae bacterium ST9]